MSHPENAFIAAVHRKLPPVNQFYRMKNHNIYNGGIADCWYSDRRDLWVEYKFLTLPKRGTTVIDLVSKGDIISVLQADWLAARFEEGRNVWVIVGTPEGGAIFRARAWEKSYTAEVFRTFLLSKVDLAHAIFDFCRKGSKPP